MGDDLRLAVVRREGAVAFLCARSMQRLMRAIDTLSGSTRGCSKKLREVELAYCKSREKNIGLRGV